MPFRYNKILKFLAILLFSFELLAPACLPDHELGETRQPSDQASLNALSPSFDYLSHLIFEEASSEEREGKDDVFTDLFVMDVFNVLVKFEPAEVTWQLPKEQFDTQPALYRLHRILLI